MDDCLHTSTESLSKLVKWAHSHGTICTLIPNLKHLLTEGAHGNLTALWGCSAGHAYHWPLMSSCKTAHKERPCYPSSSRGISSNALIQGASSMQSSQAERFLSSAGKNKGGDSNQTRDSCDFSNCSEPSEIDDNTDEYNNHLFDIVCESSATDEEGDSEPRVAQRKRGPKGPEDTTDPEAKKIKQERAEDYYTVANSQIPGGSQGPHTSSGVPQLPRPNSQTRPSSRSSAHQRSSDMDGESGGISLSPLNNASPSVSKPTRTSGSTSHSRTHINSTPMASHSAAASNRPGKSDMFEGLPNGDIDVAFGDASGTVNTEMDILGEQALGEDAKGEGTGCLAPSTMNSEEHYWPSASEFSPNAERPAEERKELEDFITTIDPITLQNLQAVISRVLVIHERTRVPEVSPPRVGVQELFPGCGLYLPTSRLTTIHQESRQDSMRLFHLLFEHFFSEEDLIGAVAFGKRGKVPDGKKILDRRTVDGIIAYVLHCSSLDGWTPVESAKLKKACINKCRLRIGQRKRLAQEPYLFHSPQKSGPSYM
uniref:BEN domain-containing protein n=1 Tax=Astyanax mexicanus TaxID=7994 RepID=A0A8B9LF90_ASTMX